MTASVVPPSVAAEVENIQKARSTDHGGIVQARPLFWALKFETLDEGGMIIVSQMASFNSASNANLLSMWLYASLTPDNFISQGLIDTEHIDWLIGQLSWVEELEDYDPKDHENHRNYKAALDVRRAREKLGPEAIRLTMLVSDREWAETMTNGDREIFKAIAEIL